MTIQDLLPTNYTRVVYIVDDDEAVRDSLAWLLKGNGFITSCHESAERFLQALSSAKPMECACILLDINLPGISGMDLQKKLKDEGYKIPIAFLTGAQKVSQAVEALKQRAFDFIQKPFKEDGLCKIIPEMLD
jgi:FixJ family two-component response regulator